MVFATVVFIVTFNNQDCAILKIAILPQDVSRLAFSEPAKLAELDKERARLRKSVAIAAAVSNRFNEACPLFRSWKGWRFCLRSDSV